MKDRYVILTAFACTAPTVSRPLIRKIRGQQGAMRTEYSNFGNLQGISAVSTVSRDKSISLLRRFVLCEESSYNRKRVHKVKTMKYGIAGFMAFAVIGLTGCSTTVENPPAVENHTTTVLPTRETHTNTVIPVPGPSTHTNTNTTTEKTTVLPGSSDSSGGTSTSTKTDSSTSKSP